MSLQYRFFIVPITDFQEAEIEFNRFLRSVRVINIDRQFVVDGENSYWVFAVEFLTGESRASGEGADKKKEKIDYKEELSPEDFAIFVKLREWRKEAAASESIPVYTILTNEQLAIIAKKRILTHSDLKEIEGIGEARIKKYGDSVIRIIEQETSKVTVQND